MNGFQETLSNVCHYPTSPAFQVNSNTPKPKYIQFTITQDKKNLTVERVKLVNVKYFGLKYCLND